MQVGDHEMVDMIWIHTTGERMNGNGRKKRLHMLSSENVPL